MDEKIRQKLFANVLLSDGYQPGGKFVRTNVKKNLIGFALVTIFMGSLLVISSLYLRGW